ncbi:MULTISPECIES: hypothetical protein [Xanthomarina]|jgi:hypothetical protein|uniref:Uncharacterized protein n=1 Tax=Xanthomarina gelatinilytica TaxID=1137281 RepID=A0A3D6BS81_9FLAO|nr:hypothetical protein [Xanthomarina sp.]MBF62850.1 hypothetical protein [Xanthomarina sp.]MDX1316972.1 hypothetical protein [Xanthomarina gelatinilytica]HAI16800.1 hypothetical protein [Xanthomarina gelatinilytica]HCY82101.1 hypothetical protein [Xanthomarina gelatinilytica]|tara:strand:+ start:5001 stop:5414 length:414 start_codon:yes stop_codon:yes gene_type:complete
MTFENSKHFNLLPSSKIEFSFGTFFFLEKIIISELNEGIHFDWGKIEQVISAIGEHYGDQFEVGFISNRINSYSIEPQLWIDFYKEYNFIVASAVVAYNKFNYKNATLEKHFSKTSIKRCQTLNEAIEWILSLKEFN